MVTRLTRQAFHRNAQALILLMLTGGTPTAAAEIDACKHFVIADIAVDTLTLARHMREQAAKRAFPVVAKTDAVPPTDALSSCTVVASWLGSLEEGHLSVRVINTADGTPLASTDVRGSNKLGFDFMVRSAAEKAYAQLGYTGFKPDVARARMERLYPARPKYDVSKTWLAAWKPVELLEGVWADPDGTYRLAVLPSPKGFAGTYVGVVLESASPLWQPGEVKIEFTGRAASPAQSIPATFYLLNKQPVDAAFAVADNGDLEGTLMTPAGRQAFRLRRAAPQGR